MNLLDVLQLVIVAIVAIWGIYQTRVTKQLEQQILRLNIGLDQSIQLLHRAREAVINIHGAHVFLLEYCQHHHDEDFTEVYATKFAEMSAYQAELRGLAFAIEDEELLTIVNKGYDFTGIPSEDRNFVKDEMEIRHRSQLLHTRISKLLEMATK